MSKLIGFILLLLGLTTAASFYYAPAIALRMQVELKFECRSDVTRCSAFAERQIRNDNYAPAAVALEKNCKVGDLKSCFRLAQVFERQEDLDRANLFYEFSCQSGFKGSCEAYGQFLAGPALGHIDGVPSMRVACSGGEAEACAFVAAAAYASGNNHEAYKYWAHICQKLRQTNVCLWGAQKFDENGQVQYGLALQDAACKGGHQASCEIVQQVKNQQAQIIQAQNEARITAQNRELASIRAKKKASTKLPLKLPAKKKRR